MITFHIGHLIVDVIEQLYSMMIDTYGEVITDSIILIDVGGADEREILQEKLSFHTDIMNDMFATTLN